MFAVRSTDLRAPVARSGARAGLFSGVLPRVLRRPFRVLLRTGVSDMHVPGYAAPLMTGALFLATLREEIGDEQFWDGVRAYTRAHAGGTVTSVDFQRAMEEASGRDLAAIFDQWVFGEDGTEG